MILEALEALTLAEHFDGSEASLSRYAHSMIDETFYNDKFAASETGVATSATLVAVPLNAGRCFPLRLAMPSLLVKKPNVYEGGVEATEEPDTYYAELVICAGLVGFGNLMGSGGFAPGPAGALGDGVPSARPPARVLSAKAAVGLLAVALALFLFLLPAPRAEAAAYYVGGGNGVRLAVRVVDRQIVWATVGVTQICVDSERGHYRYTRHFEGLAGQAAVRGNGRFSWLEGRMDRDGPRKEVATEDIRGRIGATRLEARVLYHSWYKSPESHGRCRGASDSRPPARPEAVTVIARRRSEPAGLAFYFGGRSGGITSYFEVRGHRIVRAEIGAVQFCTDRKGGHHYDNELSAFQAPIRIGAAGGFNFRQPPDEVRALEVLRGKVEPTLISGSYGYSYGGARGRCRTGSFEPGDGQTWAVPFVAPRR